MKLSSYENFQQEEIIRQREILSAENKVQRAALHEQFPYVVCVEGFYPEIDMAVNWCWKNAGPEHGPCHDYGSEYPGCEFVLATEKIVVHLAGKDWKSYKEKTYTKPEAHEHIGNWKTFWYAKTGYDYGFMDYCFKHEADAQRFAAIAETLGMGERYTSDEWG